MIRIRPASFASAFFALALAVPAFADEPAAKPEAEPAAKPEAEVLVDGEPAVLKSEVDEIVQAQLARMGAQLGPEAAAEFAGRIRRSASRQLADKYLILRDLRAKGATATAEDRAEFFRMSGGETNVAAIAARFGVPVERVEKDLEDQILLSKKFRSFEEAAPDAESIPEEQIRKLFDAGVKAHPELTNAAPEQVRASHILVKVDKPEDDAAALEKITKLRERALAGEDFAALARENSDCPSGPRAGGDLGVFGHGAMVPEFDKAAFGQPVGEIGEIVKTSFGYHVVKVTEKIPAHARTIEDYRKEIVESIRDEAVMKAQREYVEGLRDAAKLEFLGDTVVSEPIAVPAPPAPEAEPGDDAPAAAE